LLPRTVRLPYARGCYFTDDRERPHACTGLPVIWSTVPRFMPMQLARPIASVIDFAAAKRRMRKKSHGSHRVSPVRDCVRVVIAIRSQVFLQSLRHLLNAKDDFVIVAACHDTSACLAAICEHKPDLAVFETLLPGGGAVRILAAIAAERLHV